MSQLSIARGIVFSITFILLVVVTMRYMFKPKDDDDDAYNKFQRFSVTHLKKDGPFISKAFKIPARFSHYKLQIKDGPYELTGLFNIRVLTKEKDRFKMLDEFNAKLQYVYEKGFIAPEKKYKALKNKEIYIAIKLLEASPNQSYTSTDQLFVETRLIGAQADRNSYFNIFLIFLFISVVLLFVPGKESLNHV